MLLSTHLTSMTSMLLSRQTYTPTTLAKEGILDNHRSVLCSLCNFKKKKKKKSICYHSTGFLNYTSVITNSVILMGM